MSVQRRKPLTANVGLVSVGHHTYWGQFEGLRAELLGKTAVFAEQVRGQGVNLTDFGLLEDAETAYAVAPKLKAADLDLLFVDLVTYATSSTFGVLAREVSVPMVLVALQPLAAMDYAHATTYQQLCNDDFCSVPEFAGVAIRLGRKAPPVILGTLHDDPVAAAEVAEWCQLAKVLHDLKRARLGLMGHVLEAMLDMHVDPTAVTAAFGCHVALCEPEEILSAWRAVTEAETADKRQQILAFFDTPEPVSDPLTTKLTDADLETAARAAAALERFIEARNLDGLAYYYEGEAGSELRTVVTNLIVGNSLLCAAGFPMCGEYDLKTCVALLIMDRLALGGSFAEFHPLDFTRGTVLVGHDGPHHLNLAAGKPVLRSLRKYHGKPGAGASVEFCLKEGPLTMLSLGVTAEGKLKFVVAEGESVRGPLPPTGNTNTHVRFKPDLRTFLKRWVAEGPTHHFALGLGRRAATLAKLAECLELECAVVTPEWEEE